MSNTWRLEARDFEGRRYEDMSREELIAVAKQLAAKAARSDADKVAEHIRLARAERETVGWL